MPTRRAVSLVDAVAQDATIAADASSDDALRAQAAMVRALADETERLHPSDARIASLHTQLGEELERLARLVRHRTAALDDRARDGRDGEDASVDVLLVEDDADTRHATAKVLEALGYACRVVESAEDALVEYERAPAAIVLSDWNLPGQTGLELCIALKEREPQPYVILATAYHDMERQLDGMRHGADDFVRKPADLQELEDRLLAASRLIRAVRAVARLKDRLRS